MKNLYFLLPSLFFLMNFSFAQNAVINLKYSIDAITLSNDKNNLAFIANGHLYFADVAEFKIKDSIKLNINTKSKNTFLRYKSENDKIIYRIPNNSSDYDYIDREYPQDSTYVLDIKTKKVTSLPGNNYYGLSNKPDKFIIGTNDYDKEKYYPRNESKKGTLTSYPEKILAKANGIIRNIQIAPNEREFAIVYFDTIISNYPDTKEYYTIETREFPNQKIINSKKIEVTYPFISLDQMPLDVHYSDDSVYLLLCKGPFSQLLETSSLTSPLNIPNSVRISGVEERGFWKMEIGEFDYVDFKTEHLIYRLKDRLLGFEHTRGLLTIDESQKIIFGDFGDTTKKEKVEWKIIKYNIEDNLESISQKSEDFNEEIAFNPNKISIQNNSAGESMGSSIISLNEDKTILLCSYNNGKNLQLWSTKDKKKLHDINFKNEITAYLSKNGSYVLIFECNDNNIGGNMIRKLDLKSGIITTKICDFMFNKEIFCNNNKTTGDWDCNMSYYDGLDRIEQIFYVDSKSLSITWGPKIDKNNEQNTREEIYSIPESNRILFYTTTGGVNFNPINNCSRVKIFDGDTKKTIPIPNFKSTDYIFPFSSTELVLKENNQLKLVDILTQKTKLEFVFEKKFLEQKIIKVIRYNDYTYIFMRKDWNYLLENVTVFQFNTNSKSIKRTIELPDSSNFFIANDEISYFTVDGIFSYDISLNKTKSWNITKESYSSFDVDESGYLLTSSSVINLKTLEENKKPLYTNSLLLDFDENEKKTLLFADSYLRQYQFKISEIDNIENPIWTSEKYTVNSYHSFKMIHSSKRDFVLFYMGDDYNKSDLNNFFLVDIKKRKVIEKELVNITKATFSENGKLIYFRILDKENLHKTVIYNIANESFEDSEVENFDLVTNDGIFYKDLEGIIFLKNNFEFKNKPKAYYKNTYSYLSTYVYLSDNKIIVGGDDLGILYFWKVTGYTPFKELNAGNSAIDVITEMKNKLYVKFRNSEIKIIDLATYTVDVTLKIASNNIPDESNSHSTIWFTDDGYFKSSKSDLKKFHFVKGMSSFPLSRYELIINRPDIIIQKLGFASEEFLLVYKEAYSKRLKRNGIKDLADFLNAEEPKISIVNKYLIPQSTLSETIDLDVQIDTDILKIASLKTYVNGVPLYEQKNKQATNLIYKKNNKIAIPLNSGHNSISVVAISNEGIESIPVYLEIDMEKPKEHKIYYVGIGVSKYIENKMNLKYADKDVEKLSSILNYKFENVIIDTLTNNSVTIENVKALKSKLERTSVDDIVIVSFSGHGLVDDKFNFYFATHDIDFKNPEVRGLSYEEIQNLLDNIPARRKLLFLDSCHSGEFDDDEQLQKEEESKKENDSFKKGSVGINTKKGTKDTTSSFELMQSLFNDVNRGNGSYIISASGGKEFAFESKEWNNGVFTYSLASALHKGVRISELKSATYKQVTELTKSQQKPTSRSENIEWDWVLE